MNMNSKPFLDTADSRETSPEVMAAIFTVAEQDKQRADEVWCDPTNRELLDVWGIVTKGGEHAASDFFWGGSGSNWASEISVA